MELAVNENNRKEDRFFKLYRKYNNRYARLNDDEQLTCAGYGATYGFFGGLGYSLCNNSSMPVKVLVISTLGGSIIGYYITYIIDYLGLKHEQGIMIKLMGNDNKTNIKKEDYIYGFNKGKPVIDYNKLFNAYYESIKDKDIYQSNTKNGKFYKLYRSNKKYVEGATKISNNMVKPVICGISGLGIVTAYDIIKNHDYSFNILEVIGFIVGIIAGYGPLARNIIGKNITQERMLNHIKKYGSNGININRYYDDVNNGLHILNKEGYIKAYLETLTPENNGPIKILK